VNVPPLRPPRAAHAEPPAHAPNAALLIDFDNVTLAIRSDLSTQLRRLLNSDIFKGKVSVQRAYADWRRYPQYIVPLSEASIDLIFAPAFGSNKKNATDIRLAIDALELVFTRPEIGTFILLSGDSDFSSLVLKLKEYGKYVIGVGIRESSSDLLVQNCDEYYSYSELTGLTRESDSEHPRRDPWELVVEAVSRMKAEGDVMRSDRLKQVMQELDPGFDEKEVGFNRFSKFVAEAGQRGLLRLTKLDNGQYEVDLGPNANVPPGVAEAAPASEPRSTSPRSRRPRERAPAAASGTMTLAAAFHLLKETVAAMGGLEHEVEADSVREAMRERSGAQHDPIFERSRFQRLLRQAHDASLIELSKGEDGRYFLKLHAGALIEDRPEAGPQAAPEAPQATEQTTETDATRRPRRGRRGGRGRARQEEVPQPEGEPAQVQDAAQPSPAAEPGGPTIAAPGAQQPMLPPTRPNPRFRRGSRGLVRPPVPPEVPSAGVTKVPEPAPAATAISSRGPSVRLRKGSRGPRPAQPVDTQVETQGPAAAAPASPAAERQDRPEPPGVAEGADLATGAEEPSASGGSSLLKRVTAALQRAVRGNAEEKATEE
jgi:uncharacterized protein (TIGR00288 family)